MAYSAIALTQLLQPELAVRVMRSSWFFPRYRRSGLTFSDQKGDDGDAGKLPLNSRTRVANNEPFQAGQAI